MISQAQPADSSSEEEQEEEPEREEGRGKGVHPQRHERQRGKKAEGREAKENTPERNGKSESCKVLYKYRV